MTPVHLITWISQCVTLVQINTPWLEIINNIYNEPTEFDISTIDNKIQSVNDIMHIMIMTNQMRIFMFSVAHSMKLMKIISVIALWTEIQCLMFLIQQVHNYNMIHVMSIHTGLIFGAVERLELLRTFWDKNADLSVKKLMILEKRHTFKYSDLNGYNDLDRRQRSGWTSLRLNTMSYFIKGLQKGNRLIRTFLFNCNDHGKVWVVLYHLFLLNQIWLIV